MSPETRQPARRPVRATRLRSACLATAIVMGRAAVPVAMLLATTLVAPLALADDLAPFTTDGCSLFPDRAPDGKDWCNCCLRHDLAYWQGGTAEERLAADRELRSCVSTTTGDEALARLMFTGVRAGGGPYLATSYRWGYGWPWGRLYTPLTATERERAKALRARYEAENPALTCPGSPGRLAARPDDRSAE